VASIIRQSSASLVAARAADILLKKLQRRRKPSFNPFLYEYRIFVERFFSKLKHFRAMA